MSVTGPFGPCSVMTAPGRRPAGRAAGGARPGRSSPSSSPGGSTARSGGRRRSARAACTGSRTRRCRAPRCRACEVKPRSRSTLTSTQRPWQSNPFCQRWSSPSMAWKRWKTSLYVRPQAWWTPIGLLAVIGPVEEAPAGPARVLGAQAGEGPPLAPEGEDLVLLGDEVGLAADGVEHRASAGVGAASCGRARRHAAAPGAVSARRTRFTEVPRILPAMNRPQEPRRRARSAFAAAFLSLLFPGLGHAYAGAWHRALGFAARAVPPPRPGAGHRRHLPAGAGRRRPASRAVLVAILVGNVVALAVPGRRGRRRLARRRLPQSLGPGRRAPRPVALASSRRSRSPACSASSS